MINAIKYNGNRTHHTDQKVNRNFVCLQNGIRRKKNVIKYLSKFEYSN